MLVKVKRYVSFASTQGEKVTRTIVAKVHGRFWPKPRLLHAQDRKQIYLYDCVVRQSKAERVRFVLGIFEKGTP
jgi:hypothetical protein